jgi:hypothetical protein
VDSLDIFAELFIGFAGFSGIVAALRGSRDREWHAIDRTRLIVLIASSILGIFAAVLPKSLHNFGADDSSIWRISSGFLATLMLIMFGLVAKRFRQTKAFEHRDFSPVFTVAAGLFILPTIIVLALSALNVYFEANIGLYSLGLLANLVICSGMFVLLLRLVLRDA